MKTLAVATKRIYFSTRRKRQGFDQLAMPVLGICQLLANAGNHGLTVADLVDGLADNGMLLRGQDECQTVSMLLQRLIKIDVVDHPTGPNTSHKYILVRWPQIDIHGKTS